MFPRLTDSERALVRPQIGPQALKPSSPRPAPVTLGDLPAAASINVLCLLGPLESAQTRAILGPVLRPGRVENICQFGWCGILVML